MNAKGGAAPLVIAYTPRERTRTWVKRVAGKRLGRLVLTRTPQEFSGVFRRELVDAALVEISPMDDGDRAAGLALEYPSVAFFGITPFRAADGPALARCAELDFADVLVEAIDEGVLRDLVNRHGYSARFASVLASPPPALSLGSPLHLAAWHFIVAGAGRPVRTSVLASALRVTREHLSRSFGGGGAPTLKRLIDLVRLLSAAELAKNPGYDASDVARVLRFSSSAHLSLTAQRLIGRRATSLAAMRGVDVLDRFVAERARTGVPRAGARGGASKRSPGGSR